MGLPGSLDALDSSKVIALDFRSAEFRRNAHRLVAGWAQQPPFYVLGDGPPQVIVGRYADVHEVFSDAERFASRLPKGPGYEQYDKFMGFPFLTQMDGEQHARLRRLLMPAFSSRRMAQLELSITDIIETMLDDIERQGPEFDAMVDYGAKLVVGALVTTMMGLNEEQRQVLLDYQEMLPIATAIKPGQPYPPECQIVTKRAVDLVQEVIAERRAGLRSDFLDDLVQARDHGDKLNDQELFGMIFGLFGALAATSRSAGGALYTLYTHPDQLAQLIRDPTLIPDALEECLRFASNGYFTFARIATRDTEVGGTADPQRHDRAAIAARRQLRSDGVSRAAAVRHPSQTEAHHVVCRRPASLRRQHSRPHHHHGRDPPVARAFSERPACRSRFRARVRRIGRRVAPAKPADEDPMNAISRRTLPAVLLAGLCLSGGRRLPSRPIPTSRSS